MKVINSSKAPTALGSYSQAVISGGFLWLSMQLGLDAKSGKLPEGFTAQMEQVMENLGAVLKSGESCWNEVVKVSIYLVDLNDFSEMNRIYGRYFEEQYPVREVMEIRSLPRSALVGVSLTARKS